MMGRADWESIVEPVSRGDLTLGSKAILIATVLDECKSDHKLLISLEKLSVPVLGSHSTVSGDRWAMNPSTMEIHVVTLLSDGLARPARESSSIPKYMYMAFWEGIKSYFSRFITSPNFRQRDLSQDVCSWASWRESGSNNQ